MNTIFSIFFLLIIHVFAFGMGETTLPDPSLVFAQALQCDLPSVHSPGGLEYPRDYSFPLKHSGGKQYIPRDLDINEIEFLENHEKGVILGYYDDEYRLLDAKAAAFSDLARGVVSSDAFIGKSSLLINFLYENNFSYLAPGATIVEGGNIHFITVNEKTKAIIGDHSLLLTYLIAVHNKFYELDKRAEQLGHSDRSHPNYGVAKARVLVEEYPLTRNDAMTFSARLKTDSLFHMDVLEAEAQKDARLLQWCRQQIANEIHLPVEDVIFIPQRNYHIDFDLLVTNDQRVILRAPLPEEREIWQTTMDILLREVGEKYLITDHLFTDRLLFCGLPLYIKYSETKATAIVNSDKWPVQTDDAHSPIASCFLVSQAESASQDMIDEFSAFLRHQGGFSYVWGFIHPDYERCAMGIHCLSQEYFKNVGEREEVCYVCKKPGRLIRCQAPCLIPFCSLDCQKRAWFTGHKETCANRKSAQSPIKSARSDNST